jgi:hypothetical protein
MPGLGPNASRQAPLIVHPGSGCRLVGSEIGVVGMSTERGRATEFLPLLSRGKHRRPRNGACVMEYASYLAGVKWSDHPACTHPLLGELARQVNDFSSDEARQTLVELVPDMIGLTGTDPRIDVRIALRAAQTALPVVAAERQQIMAVAVLTCERVQADLDGRVGAPLSQDSSDALALAPAAATWASRYVRNLHISQRAFRRQAAPTIVRYAVQGIAHACTPDPDSLLHDLLVGAIEDSSSLRCPERRYRPAHGGLAATTASPSAAEAAATLSGQISV